MNSTVMWITARGLFGRRRFLLLLPLPVLVIALAVLCRWLGVAPGNWAQPVLIALGLAVVLPVGSAGVDNIVWPLVLAPIFWALLFTYACLEESLTRGAAILGAIGILSGISVGVALAA